MYCECLGESRYVFRGGGSTIQYSECIADVLCTYPATFVNNTWNTHDNTPKYKKVRIGRVKCPLWEGGVYVIRTNSDVYASELATQHKTIPIHKDTIPRPTNLLWLGVVTSIIVYSACTS